MVGRGGWLRTLAATSTQTARGSTLLTNGLPEIKRLGSEADGILGKREGPPYG
jgi:hypothetical protein